MATHQPKTQKPKIILTAILLLASIAVIVAMRNGNGSKNLTSAPVLSPRAKGNPRAPFKVIEFVDFQCPACGAGAKILSEQFIQHPNQFYVEIKYFPLASTHKHALRASIYAECAARQGKFWTVADRLFETQSQWSSLLSAEPFFNLIAQQQGVDEGAYKQCLEEPNISEVLFKDKEEGRVLGIDRTPSYLINGKLIVGTASLQEEIDGFFNKKSSP